MGGSPPPGSGDDHPALLRDYSGWIGVERTRSETIAPWPARALAATLDRDAESHASGRALPPGWHWIYFNETPRASALGEDGHEARGGFLPPVPLPRRMWAGGRIRFHAPLHIGERAERTSVVERVTPKRGRSGALVFVTVRHRIVGPGGLAVDEEQEIVYREPASPAPASSGSRDVTSREASHEVLHRIAIDPVVLFRFSALTFNGHRIHYDHRYATEVEGYPDLVVHGPLLALLLLGSGLESGVSEGRDFEYRALAPLFCGETLEILAERHATPGGEVRLWASHPTRGPAMEAWLR